MNLQNIQNFEHRFIILINVHSSSSLQTSNGWMQWAHLIDKIYFNINGDQKHPQPIKPWRNHIQTFNQLWVWASQEGNWF